MHTKGYPIYLYVLFPLLNIGLAPKRLNSSHRILCAFFFFFLFTNSSGVFREGVSIFKMFFSGRDSQICIIVDCIQYYPGKPSFISSFFIMFIFLPFPTELCWPQSCEEWVCVACVLEYFIKCAFDPNYSKLFGRSYRDSFLLELHLTSAVNLISVCSTVKKDLDDFFVVPLTQV